MPGMIDHTLRSSSLPPSRPNVLSILVAFVTECNVVDIFPVAHENQVLAIDQLQLKITHEVSQLELCQHSVKLEAQLVQMMT